MDEYKASLIGKILESNGLISFPPEFESILDLLQDMDNLTLDPNWKEQLFGEVLPESFVYAGIMRGKSGFIRTVCIRNGNIPEGVITTMDVQMQGKSRLFIRFFGEVPQSLQYGTTQERKPTTDETNMAIVLLQQVRRLLEK